MPLFVGLGGLALGVGKNFLFDQPKYQREKKLAASTQRYSPWTGMQAKAPNEPDPVAAGLTYGSQGAMLGQGLANANASKDLMEAQKSWLQNNRAYNPWAIGY